MGALAYQRFPLSKTAECQNIALPAVPAHRAFNVLVSAFPAHSTSFSLNLFNRQRVECVLNSESDGSLVVGIQLVSP